MISPFNPGDLVELRSGSPPCLVKAVRNGNVTFATWNREGKEIEAELPAACLRLYGGKGVTG